MKILRLLLWPDCPRKCPKCCNKNYDIENLPVLETFEGWDAICFTGGEPLLYPKRVLEIAIRAANENPTAKRYLYTALPGWPLESVIRCFHGVTVSVQNRIDFERLALFDRHHRSIRDFSYVVKLFDRDPGFYSRNFPRWKFKAATWQDDCPLPENETFMRLDY